MSSGGMVLHGSSPGIQRSETYLTASRAQEHSPEILPVSKYGPHIRVFQHHGHRLIVDKCFRVTIENNPRIIGSPGAIKFDDLVRVETLVRAPMQYLQK
eukprot:11765-Heterococcus_DN1.PRE.2